VRTFAATVLCLSVVALTVSAAPGTTVKRCHLRWRIVPSPRFSDARLADVQALKPNLVWVAGSGITSGGRPTRILVEHWDGHHWRARRLPQTGFVDGLAASSNRDIWLVGEGPDFTPLILHYGGDGWTQLPSPLPSGEHGWLHDVLALGPRDAWAVGSNDTLISPTGYPSALILHWDGSRWTSVSGPPGLGALFGITALSAHDLWAVGPVDSDSLSPPVMTHWNGASWRVVDDSELGYVDLFGVKAVSPRSVWAVGSTGATERRGIVAHWNGVRFRIVDERNLRDSVESFNDVVSSGKSVWAVGGWGIDRWDGRRWLKRPFRGVSFRGADAISARNVWAVGGDGRGSVVYHYACQ
jgi:hypothetical protein